jgi:pimeloyl-ACP methyl ester carboxylesterase
MAKASWLRIVCRIGTLTALMMSAAAGGSEPSNPNDHPAPMPLPAPTLGGKQFWADELFFHQWRIQRNVLSDHCRLLDGRDFRHASGSFEQCRARLEEIKRDRNLPPMRGKAVVVLHGLGRTRSSMSKLCQYLEEQGGYTVFNVAYPSTRRDVGSHAVSLARIIDNLDGIEEINFVAHSMGNVVIRRYLADCYLAKQAENKFPPAAGEHRPPPLKRFVMLAPPNHGSLLALALADNTLFKAVTGAAGKQIGSDWDKLEGTLAIPRFEFGIIAGGKNDGRGFNSLLPGDNDGTITVATTQLIGASDFVVVPVLHTFIMSDERVLCYVLRFLQNGYFVSDAARQPVREDF